MEEEVSSLNSKLEHTIQSESNVNVLDGMVEYGGMSRDMKRNFFGTSIKEQNMKTPLTKSVLLEMKIEVLRADHMS